MSSVTAGPQPGTRDSAKGLVTAFAVVLAIGVALGGYGIWKAITDLLDAKSDQRVIALFVQADQAERTLTTEMASPTAELRAETTTQFKLLDEATKAQGVGHLGLGSTETASQVMTVLKDPLTALTVARQQGDLAMSQLVAVLQQIPSECRSGIIERVLASKAAAYADAVILSSQSQSQENLEWRGDSLDALKTGSSSAVKSASGKLLAFVLLAALAMFGLALACTRLTRPKRRQVGGAAKKAVRPAVAAPAKPARAGTAAAPGADPYGPSTPPTAPAGAAEPAGLPTVGGPPAASTRATARTFRIPGRGRGDRTQADQPQDATMVLASAQLPGRAGSEPLFHYEEPHRLRPPQPVPRTSPAPASRPQPKLPWDQGTPSQRSVAATVQRRPPTGSVPVQSQAEPQAGWSRATHPPTSGSIPAQSQAEYQSGWGRATHPPTSGSLPAHSTTLAPPRTGGYARTTRPASFQPTRPYGGSSGPGRGGSGRAPVTTVTGRVSSRPLGPGGGAIPEPDPILYPATQAFNSVAGLVGHEPPVSIEDTLAEALAQVARPHQVRWAITSTVALPAAVAPRLAHVVAELVDAATAKSPSLAVLVSAQSNEAVLQVAVSDRAPGAAFGSAALGPRAHAVQALASRMGAALGVSPGQNGRGTCVRVTLPLQNGRVVAV
ncbi:MAG: hypothetical protein LBR19_00790 [Bifidobacteriaceae bacterium]|jgi:hypothetical protein|nr:hypothetical protein [Bifidobacteriaceae bacterium]